MIWDKPSRLAFAILIVGACASLIWLVHPYYEATTGTNDGSMYILSAKALLAGEGYAYLGQPFTVRPPGMSVLIAPLIAWRGLDYHALHLLVSLFGVAAIGLLFVLVRPRLGTWIAFLFAVSVWVNPAYRHMSNQVMSDVPGVALLIGCLLVERWASRRPTWRRELILGFSIAIAAYLRTIHVLLVPAIVVARVLQQVGGGASLEGWGRFAARRVLVFASTLGLLLLPWNLRNAAHPPQTPVDQNYIHSYSTAMLHADPGDPASPRLPPSKILERVPKRAGQILSLVGSRLEDSAARVDDFGRTEEDARGGAARVFRRVLGGVVLILAFATFVRKRRASDAMLFANLSILLVYFGFQDRLVLPIYLLAIPAALELVIDTSRKLRREPPARIAVGIALVAVAALDFRPRAGWRDIRDLHEAYSRFSRDVAAAVPASTRLAATVGWHYSVYLDRPVYTLLFAMRRAGSVQGAEEVIDKYRIGAVILTPPTEQALFAYFRQSHPSVTMTSGGGAIVQVGK